MSEERDPVQRDAGELAEALERQLASALAPDPVRVRRARANVLASYQSTLVAGRRSGWHVPRGWTMAAAFAVMLAAGVAMVAAESGPGQPFYGVRLGIGRLLLPSGAAARDRGLASELDDRLAEARGASRHDDVAALMAALEAYRTTLSELTQGGIDDASVISALQRHRDLLQGLIDNAPGAAQAGLEQALHQAEQAVATPLGATPNAVPRATPVGNPGQSSHPTRRP